MKNITTRLLVFGAFLFCAYMIPNTAQAQLPDGYNLDFWEHQTPTVKKSGGWLSIYLYPGDGRWESFWNRRNYTITTKILYSNGNLINLNGNMFSSGVEMVVPARPADSDNYPYLVVTLTHNQNAHSPYTFTGYFYQK